MPAYSPLDILKEALLLERRGQAFYQNAADQANHPAVQAFFQTMADEEGRHIEILGEQFRAYAQNQQFVSLDADTLASRPLADQVLTQELKTRIAGAGFEAAAISAAMLMEEKAVVLYASQAKAAADPSEKALYRWLADWEQGHLTYLARLDQEIKESLWQDNQFWPF